MESERESFFGIRVDFLCFFVTLFCLLSFFQAVCVFDVNKVRLCFNIDVREVKRRTIWPLCVCVCVCV